MNTNGRKKILWAGLILSAICLIASLIILIQPPSGPYGRLPMTGILIMSILVGLTFFLQIRQKNTDN